MTRKLTKRWMALAVAVAMVLSPLVATAGAEWTAWNPDAEPEPDTGNDGEDLGDYDDEYMHQGPASSDSEIYFDAILDKNSFPFVTSPNAHDPVDTDLRNFGVSYFHAMLGYWQDCNDDGFIGLAETGQTHYRAELGGSSCDGTAHHDGTHVTEFLPIGPEAKEPDQSGVGQALSLQGHDQAVQDHFAKVWHDWGFPGDDPAETRLLFPLPKGTFADSNGAFQYVDSLTFGSLSGTSQGTDCFAATTLPSDPVGDETDHEDACALWPASQSNTDDDRAEPRQCTEEAGDGTLSAGTAEAYAANVQEGITGENCDDPGTSPIPNVKTVDLDVAQVDWPANIAKERYNSSDDPDEQGQTVTEPVECDANNGNEGDHISLAGWVTDPQAAVVDGEALEGYDGVGSNEQAYAQSYLSGDDGPSVIPTVDKIYGPVVFELAQTEAGSLVFDVEDCYEASQPAPNTLVLQDTPPVPEKTEADTTFSYFQDTHTVQQGTQYCLPTDSALFVHANKCAGHWYSNSQWFHSHGLTTLDATGPLASFEATFYADVSGGDEHADGVLDDFNSLSSANLYAENDSTLVNDLWSTPFGSPDVDVPAGELNNHTYGEHACHADGTEGIDSSPDDPGNHSESSLNDLDASTSGWSCDRNEWVEAADRDPDPSNWNDEAIQAVYLTPKVGDYFDLRDLECQDNDVAGQETTDTSGPLGSDGGTDCEALSESQQRIPT